MSEVIEDIPKWIARIKDQLLEASLGGHIEEYLVDEAIEFLNFLEIDQVPDPSVLAEYGESIRFLFSGTGKAMTVVMYGDRNAWVRVEIGESRRITVDRECGVAGFRRVLIDFYPTIYFRLNEEMMRVMNGKRWDA